MENVVYYGMLIAFVALIVCVHLIRRQLLRRRRRLTRDHDPRQDLHYEHVRGVKVDIKINKVSWAHQ